MTNLFGSGSRSDLLLLSLAEAVACFGAAYVLLAFGVAPGSQLTPAQAAGLAAAIALLAAAATRTATRTALGVALPSISPASTGVVASGSAAPTGDGHGLVPGELGPGVMGPGAMGSGAKGRAGPPAGRAVVRAAVALAPGLLLALAAGAAAGLLLPAHDGSLSWSWLAGGVVAAGLALAAVRFGVAAATGLGLAVRPVALLGDAGAFDRPDTGGRSRFKVVSRLPAVGTVPLTQITEGLRGQRPWALVAGDVTAVPEPLRRWCGQAGVRVLPAAEFRELQSGRVDLDLPLASWSKDRTAASISGGQAVATRLLDIGCGVVLLVATLPVLLVTAFVIKLESRGPVFYRQQRVGLGGQVFTLFKFRSMVQDAEAGGAPRWATQHDPRVTRVGRFIRLTRIDEIPQVLNVLRGEMAFVGPRPERPAFVEQLAQVIPHYNERARVKPGITGWAQVNYPYGASVEDARMKLTYDLYYVRRRSLLLDLQILFATVRVVLFQVGSR